jgi:hypothetical protein
MPIKGGKRSSVQAPLRETSKVKPWVDALSALGTLA